jgi:hypothetical protein
LRRRRRSPATVAAAGARRIGDGRDHRQPGGGRRAAAELALSDEQRGRIYEGVMRIPDAPVARAPAPALADALPQEVPMQDPPAGVTHEILPARPQIREVRRPHRGGRSGEPRSWP